ncbi:MAG: hypothetical protein H7X88_00005, partial [Gloeobacteraceae cyanobacterium ES-bin-316]|nr:hypothetical protein [Ferruginibacter sp.]
MSPMALKIGSMELGKQMIYIHPDPENYHTDIFKEANTLGLLGNKLFENKICLIDFTRMKFTILN